MCVLKTLIRKLKDNYLMIIIIIIIILGIIGVALSFILGKDWETLDGWYSGLATAVSVIFMYVELINSKKEEAKGEVLILTRPNKNKVEFTLYNSGQKAGAFEFIGIMRLELFQKYKRNPDNPDIIDSNGILIDPTREEKSIAARIIALKGQSVSEVYSFTEKSIEDLFRSNNIYGKQVAVIVYRALNGQIVCKKKTVEVDRQLNGR